MVRPIYFHVDMIAYISLSCLKMSEWTAAIDSPPLMWFHSASHIYVMGTYNSPLPFVQKQAFNMFTCSNAFHHFIRQFKSLESRASPPFLAVS